MNALKRFWCFVRQLSGDDAYEQYLKHYALHHQGEEEPPLTREAFYKEWQDRKWKGVKRCC